MSRESRIVGGFHHNHSRPPKPRGEPGRPILALIGFTMAVYQLSVGGSTSWHPGNPGELPMTAATDKGIVDHQSHHSVDQTVDRLKSLLQSKGVTLFALIDHSGEAAKAGLTMRPTKLLIFGNPKAGTPLMIASPSIAIDLPLKLLVWEDEQGKTWISYNAPAFLQARHGVPADLAPVLAVVEALATKAGE
jgi:uncharacterized protein (DUF302 family)